MIGAATALVTATRGVTFAQLCRRLPNHEPRVLWLVLRDELAAGRVACSNGRYYVVASEFDVETFEALRTLTFGEVYE